jgi:hypothetical protein
MSHQPPRLPLGPKPPSARRHRRRRPIVRYADVDWDSLREPYQIGVSPDATVAQVLRCTPRAVARYREEHGIPAPPAREEKWPSDDELRRQNEESAFYREAEVRLYPLRSSAWWMDGRLGVGESDEDDC